MKIYLVMHEVNNLDYDCDIRCSYVISAHSSLEKANIASRKYVFDDYEKNVTCMIKDGQYDDLDEAVDELRSYYTFPDSTVTFDTKPFEYCHSEWDGTFSIYIKEIELD